MRKLFFIILLSSFFSKASPLTLVIDPGHGGTDLGTTRGPLKESYIVLKVSELLKKELEAKTSYKVLLTRTKDINLSLQDRVQMALDNKARLLISIHVNSSPSSKVKGVEFYFQNQLPSDEESLYMAAKENDVDSDLKNLKSIPKKSDIDLILEDLQHQTHIKASYKLTQLLNSRWKLNRASNHTSIRQAPFYMVSNLPFPAVLIELGYLSESHEAENLSLESTWKEMAQSITQAIIDFNLDKSEKPL